MWRYLNMFVLIGIALVGISLAGFLTGNRFLTEPGQPINPQGSLIYLGAGIIMLFNGVISIKQAEAMRSHGPPNAPTDDAKAAAKSGEPTGSQPSPTSTE